MRKGCERCMAAISAFANGHSCGHNPKSCLIALANEDRENEIEYLYQLDQKEKENARLERQKKERDLAEKYAILSNDKQYRQIRSIIEEDEE